MGWNYSNYSITVVGGVCLTTIVQGISKSFANNSTFVDARISQATKQVWDKVQHDHVSEHTNTTKQSYL